MTASDLFNYLDSVRSDWDLKKIPVYVSEKESLFSARELDSAIFLMPSSRLNNSIVLCPTPLTRNGEEIKSILDNKE